MSGRRKFASSTSMISAFWRYASKAADGECWTWTGPLLNPKEPERSYGLVRVAGYRELAHRFSYEIAKGPLAGQWALHHCDNPRCVNPAHLYAGSPADNGRDVSARGRHPSTHAICVTKYAGKYRGALNDALIDIGITAGEFARRAGISTGTVYTWLRSGRRPMDHFAERITAGLGRPFSVVFGESPYPETADRRTKRSPSRYDQARSLRAEGVTFKEIAARVGVHQMTVYRWLTPETAARWNMVRRKRAA